MTTPPNKQLYGYMKVRLNYAPRTNGKKFKAWCDDQGFVPLNSGRRAWSSSLATYLRGASGVAYADGEPFLFYEEDLVDVDAIKIKAQHQLLLDLEQAAMEANDLAALEFIVGHLKTSRTKLVKRH